MEIRLNSEVSLQEAEDTILEIGKTNAIHLVGEPGIGKTAMFHRLVERTGYRGVYIDTPNVELGELGIPMPDHATQTTTLYPNKHWGFHHEEPMVIFIDEITKPSSQAVVNMLHPLLNERRMANFKLHEDTIVVSAGNNSSDGVGDAMKSHTISRITIMPVRKPNWEEYVEYGSRKGYAPEMLAFVKAYPHVLASYKDPTQVANMHIFQPKMPQKSYFCPRSGERASNVIKKRGSITKNALVTALIGTIGEPTARDLLAYVDVADTLPSWEEVITSPSTASVPQSPAALCIMAYGALQRVERANVNKWFEYMKRTPKELQSVFCLTARKHPKAKEIVLTSPAFVTWMRENQYLF
jgi:hypothetical protein